MAVQRVQGLQRIRRVAGWRRGVLTGCAMLAAHGPLVAQSTSLLATVFKVPAPTPSAPTNAYYKMLLKRATEYLNAERYAEALEVAREAERANPHHFRGYYDEALALMHLGQLDKAEAAIQKARSQPLPRDEDKAAVDKLTGMIRLRQDSLRWLTDADTARTEGQFSKAATMYEQAWLSGRIHTEAVFKAADLYAHSLGQPVTAARLLRQIVVWPRSEAVAEQARAMLEKLTPTLREIAAQSLRAAATQHGAEALQSLQIAAEADPEDLHIDIRRAQVVAEGGDLRALQHEIQTLARRGAATPTVLASLPRLAESLRDRPFHVYMTSLFGDVRVAEVKTLLSGAPSIPAGKSSSPAVGTIFKDCADCPEVVVLPAGSFTMGASQSVLDDEGPMHLVSVPKVAIGRTEVTQAQWRAVMRQEPPSYFVDCGPSCPVERVTWSDVQVFLQKLSTKTGHRYRLPSEAEWEYACQAGEHHTYCGGENVDELAWYGSSGAMSSGGNSGETLHPVAQKKPNAWGLFDMSGNVWEWVADCVNPNYQGAPTNGSAWMAGDCSRRIGRGGGWSVYESLVRASVRGDYSVAASTLSTSLGLRVIRVLP